MLFLDTVVVRGLSPAMHNHKYAIGIGFPSEGRTGVVLLDSGKQLSVKKENIFETSVSDLELSDDLFDKVCGARDKYSPVAEDAVDSAAASHTSPRCDDRHSSKRPVVESSPRTSPCSDAQNSIKQT